jgi:methyl-accepting chemotaxis protein
MRSVQVTSDQLLALGRIVFAKADQSKSAASRAGATAVAGAAAVNSLVEAMGTIDSMTNDIKRVAFQINLLAVNAQIEAALAGELGDGFAVVANEVKGLAERTGNLSREIEQRLNSIRTHAEEAEVSFDSITAAVGSSDKSIVELIDNQNELHNAIKGQTESSASAAGKMDTMSQLVDGVQTSLNDIGELYQRLNGSVENMLAAISEPSREVQSRKEVIDV